MNAFRHVTCAAFVASLFAVGGTARGQDSKAPTASQLQDQIEAQQSQIDALQQDLTDRQAQLDALGDIDQGLQKLNAQTEAGQAQVEARARDREARLDQLGQAIGLLRRVDAELAVGSSDVDDELEQAQDLLTGPPHEALVEARAALEQGDLYNTRLWVDQAWLTSASNALHGTGRASAQP